LIPFQMQRNSLVALQQTLDRTESCLHHSTKFCPVPTIKQDQQRQRQTQS
jgi:hypothetical protein